MCSLPFSLTLAVFLGRPSYPHLWKAPVYLSVWVQVCVQVPVPLHSHGRPADDWVVFLGHPKLFLQTWYLTEPEAPLTIDCLANMLLGSSCLCPQCWDQQGAMSRLGFYVGAGDLILGLHIYTAAT